MEWQPIETAKKDGTRVLVWDGCAAAVASWQETSEDDKRKGWPDGWYDSGTFLYEPTHWANIAPPTEGRDK